VSDPAAILITPRDAIVYTSPAASTATPSLEPSIAVGIVVHAFEPGLSRAK
jgi:hypothetical protein